MSRRVASMFDPARRKFSMRFAENLTVELGGNVIRTGRDELEFAHWSMARVCIVNATRTETSDALIAWLRHLCRNRAALRRAVGFPEER